MNGPRWSIALTARYGDGAVPPDRRASAQATALRSNVLLVFGDDSCAARFQVDAVDMALALRAAMGRWAHVTETARLPWWQVSHLEADLAPVDEDFEESGMFDIDEGGALSLRDAELPVDAEDRRLRLVE